MHVWVDRRHCRPRRRRRRRRRVQDNAFDIDEAREP